MNTGFPNGSMSCHPGVALKPDVETASNENRSTARETEAIREIGYELAIAIREVGALLIGGGWGQASTATQGDDRGTREPPG